MTPLDLIAERLDEDICGCIEDAGVEAPYTELRVEDDFVVGTVPLFEPLESELSEDLSVLKLAFERRRSSLKNGIVYTDSGSKQLPSFTPSGGVNGSTHGFGGDHVSNDSVAVTKVVLSGRAYVKG